MVPSTSLQSTITVMPGCSQDTMEPSKKECEPMTRPEMSPVCSKCVDTTSQDEKDLETLVQMFPNKNVCEYLSVLDMLLFFVNFKDNILYILYTHNIIAYWVSSKLKCTLS